MKKILLLGIFLCFAEFTFAQHFFQSGNYGFQKQKNYFSLKGRLKEKYLSCGSNWLIVENETQTYNISVVDTVIYKQSMLNDSIELKNCFKIARKKLKKKN